MKHIHRFFVTDSLAGGRTVRLEDGDAFHAARVLRLKAGDAVELADGGGRVFAAAVTAVDGTVEARVGEMLAGADPEAAARLAVVQALPKGRKLDLVVEKLAELGVPRLVPVYTDRSAARPQKPGGKFERWGRIARSAAAQSKSSRIMTVDQPADLRGWLAEHAGPVVVLSTEAAGEPLGGLAAGLAAGTDAPLALVVGPEAGFSPAELESLRAAGARFASLGGQVLRTETAALVAAAIVLHRQGRLG